MPAVLVMHPCRCVFVLEPQTARESSHRRSLPAMPKLILVEPRSECSVTTAITPPSIKRRGLRHAIPARG
jgi:hypothetical protein